MEAKKDEQTQDAVNAKRLYRSKIDRIIAGVCGGFAEYFNIEPTLVRIIWLVTLFFGGFGFLLYLISLIIMRENPEQSITDAKKPQNVALFWGVGIILLGLSILSSNWHWNLFYFRPFHFEFFSPWFFDWDRFWPVIIILLGIFYLFYVLKQNKEPGEKKAAMPHLFRSRTEKVIGGVCGGIAHNLKVDPVVVRIGWVLLSLVTKLFLGVIVYILWMIIVPEETPVQQQTETTAPPKEDPETKAPKRVKKLPKKEDDKEE